MVLLNVKYLKLYDDVDRAGSGEVFCAYVRSTLKMLKYNTMQIDMVPRVPDHTYQDSGV